MNELQELKILSKQLRANGRCMKYPEEFKKRAIQLSETMPQAQVCRELQISSASLKKWISSTRVKGEDDERVEFVSVNQIQYESKSSSPKSVDIEVTHPDGKTVKVCLPLDHEMTLRLLISLLGSEVAGCFK